jgi:hypothetical protein
VVFTDFIYILLAIYEDLVVLVHVRIGTKARMLNTVGLQVAPDDVTDIQAILEMCAAVKITNTRCVAFALVNYGGEH